MTAELGKPVNCFLDSVKQISALNPDISPVVDDFLFSVDCNHVEILTNELGVGLTLQADSLDGRLFVFIPDSFSQSWGGEGKLKAVASVVFDTVGEVRQLSGPSMLRFDDLKRDLLKRLSL